jgi:tetratricopeptide (TPR) repeat protein
MLETIRQYTREKLLETGGSEIVRDKHLAYFVKLAEQAEPELYRSNQAFWLNKLDDELDNLRMALEWALATDVETGLQIAVFSWQFWQSHGYVHEMGDWLWQFLERHDTKDSLHVRAMAIYCACITDLIRSRSIAEQSLQLARALSDKQVEAFSLMALGVVMSLQGNLKEGIPLVEQSRTLYQALGDKLGQATAMAWLVLNNNDLEQTNIIVLEGLKLFRELGHLAGIAVCLNQLAHRRIWGRDFSSSVHWLEEARALYRQLGNQSGEADILNTHGTLAYWQGDYQQARVDYEEAIMLYEKVGSYWMSSWSRANLAYTILRQGNLMQARDVFSDSIQRFQKTNTLIGLVYAIEGFASLHVNLNRPKRAAQLFAWADTMREQIGDHRPPVEQASVEKDLAIIHSKIDDNEFTRLSADGRTMTVEQAIALALEE